MNKQEFLDKLRTSLSNDFAAAEVQDQISYYSDYINEEIAKGRSEAEVVAELGDPWIVARSLVNSKADQMGENGSGNAQGYHDYKEYSEAGYDDDYGYEKRRNQQSYYNTNGDGYGRYGAQETFYGDGLKGKITKYFFEHPRVLKFTIIGVVVLVMMLLFSIMMGIFNLVAPVLVPVLVILFVIRMLKGDHRGRGRW